MAVPPVMRTLAVSVMSILLSGAALIAQQPPAREQQPTFGERVEVNAVLIDAVVTDAQGNQILGLTKDDFAVTESGVEQRVDTADYFTPRRLLNSTEGNAPFQVEQVHEERYFVFFFDKPEGAELFGRIAIARGAVRDFLARHMTPNDRVAIVGHDVRLKVYSDFTADKTQLLRALEDVSRFSKGMLKPSSDITPPSILRNVDASEMMNHSGTVYEALTVLADALKPVRARKNLVLFSAGIHEPGEVVRNGMVLKRSRYHDPMINALNAGNVTVYAMNLLSDAPSEPVFHQTLESLTRETNGDYYRYVVSFKSPLDRIVKASAGYYLLSYRTEKRGRGFQKVEVSVRNHPEFRVTARAGYSFGD